MGVNFTKNLFSLIIFLLLIIVPLFTGESNNLYTDKERLAIAKIRPLVDDLLVRDYQKKDGYLLRFLRASNFNIDAAVQKLKRNLKYRIENNIDNIFSFYSQVDENDLPYRLEGFDRAGRPVVEIMFGKWQMQKYIRAGKSKDILTYYHRVFESTIEKIFQTAESTGSDIDQLYSIANLDGLTVREQLCLGCIPTSLNIARTYDAFVSVFARNTTLINVPWFWRPLLFKLKRSVSLDSLNTLNVYDNNKRVWTEALLRDISEDQLPLRLGGTNTDFK